VIEKLRPGALDGGEIVHIDGTVLGRHEGIINYTVGQRKGLGIGGGDALYVIKLDAEKKQVIVGGKEALLKQHFTIKDCNWLGADVLSGGEIMVKMRSMQAGVPATIIPLENGRAEIILNEPQAAVSPGQACVAYMGDRLLGGGWIVNQ
jgi:tRNA-specific 2-thiouridylase